MNPQADPESEAAEYALGTLRGPARQRFEASLAEDPELRRAVAWWEARLPALAPAAPVAPSPALWHRIAVAAGLDSARPVPEPPVVVQLRRSLSRWRMAAGGAALAASLLLAAVLRPAEPPPPALVAVLTSAEGAAFAVRVPGAEPARVTPVGGRAAPAGRDYELWLVPAAGAPRSLGLVAPGGVTALDAARLPADQMRPGATLAVSLEPPGGSPTGAPTGPVLFTGQLVEAR
ncbi:MAG TPA: anti-sigma factor [Alphaproteobacteria bacterium]|nr:anti-sigma factor [Alphaproteobacteria bacterium]